jgi:hypothetical protein
MPANMPQEIRSKEKVAELKVGSIESMKKMPM